MASYTGMSNLQNHPHRSGFDIGRKNAFTAKVGELLPVYWDISMPGDKYKFNVEYFTRTQPVGTSAYTRLREYFDFYAVPLRLLWKSAPSVLTRMQDINQVQALSMPERGHVELERTTLWCLYHKVSRLVILRVWAYWVLFIQARRSYRDWETDRKSTRLNSSHSAKSRMPSSA